MRRLACLVLSGLALSGCRYASSPLDGFGTFIGNTHVFRSQPNAPPGAAENMQRAEGQPVPADPLLPESGNIWPGQPKAQPTLEDVIRNEPSGATPAAAPGTNPGVNPGGSGAGGAVPYGSAAHPQPRPAQAPGSVSPNGSNGIAPGSTPGASIIVPNGNGTSTVIGPDGSTKTIPTP